MGWLIFAAIVLALGFAVFFGAPYVPSQRRYIRRAFTDLYPLSKKDVLIDLGSGDGVVLRIAREFGAEAVGYEIHPVLVAVSRWLSRNDRGVTIKQANYWRTAWPDTTTVVYVFGVTRDSRRLVRKIQREVDRLGRPIVVLTHGSPLPDRRPEKTHDAYSLYTFRPLQPAIA